MVTENDAALMMMAPVRDRRSVNDRGCRFALSGVGVI
jgi:hypothetical protein